MNWFKKPVDVFSEWEAGKAIPNKEVKAEEPIVWYDIRRMEYYDEASKLWSQNLMEAYKKRVVVK